MRCKLNSIMFLIMWNGFGVFFVFSLLQCVAVSVRKKKYSDDWVIGVVICCQLRKISIIRLEHEMCQFIVAIAVRRTATTTTTTTIVWLKLKTRHGNFLNSLNLFRRTMYKREASTMSLRSMKGTHQLLQICLRIVRIAHMHMPLPHVIPKLNRRWSSGIWLLSARSNNAF